MRVPSLVMIPADATPKRSVHRYGIPANADCRGGVFATRRFPRLRFCSDVACRVAVKEEAIRITIRGAAPLRDKRGVAPLCDEATR